MWISVWKNYSVIHKKNSQESLVWISIDLFYGKIKDFHGFLLKKDINLLNLHQKTKLWINLYIIS